MTGKRDLVLLLDMLQAAQDAREFVAGMTRTDFYNSRLHQNAAIRSLEVIGEAAGKVSAETVGAHPDIPWSKITGMRHRLIHDYSGVRMDLVWSVIDTELYPLIRVLESLVPDEDRPQPRSGRSDDDSD